MSLSGPATPCPNCGGTMLRFWTALTAAVVAAAVATMCVCVEDVLYGSEPAPPQVSGIVADGDDRPLGGVRVSAFDDVLVENHHGL